MSCTVLLGLGMCLLSLACAVVLGLFDKRGERILKRKEGKTGEVIRLKDILRFPLSLWLVFIICVFYYITVFPQTHTCPQYTNLSTDTHLSSIH